MERKVIYPTKTTVNGMDEFIYKHYLERSQKPSSTPDYIGPVIHGVDVGKNRYADEHPTYPLIDLAKDSDVEEKDIEFAGYKARWYCPKHVEGNAPVLFYIHGGGFTMGALKRLNNINRRISQLLDGVVVHIDYTMAPEAAYPVAITQCYHCINYFHDHAEEYKIDNQKITIMGDSAGGSLCDSVIFLDREKKLVKYLVLYYPSNDCSNYSYEHFREEFYGKDLDPIVRSKVYSFHRPANNDSAYLQNRIDFTDPIVSPILASDLGFFPPTLMLTAEYDTLRMQNEQMAELLEKSGVPVEYYMYAGTFHGYLERVGFFEQSDSSMQLMVKKIKAFFRI